jgi:hypothetical protein
VALIVEDGTGVPGATSYIDVQYVRDFAAARGRMVPVEDTPIEQSAVVAMDYLASLEPRLKGQRSYDAQGQAFPRMYVRIGDRTLPYNAVPEDIKKAQAELTLATLDGFDLMPTLDGAEVKREKVGPLETEYVTGTSRGSGPVVARAFALLQPYYAVVSLRTQRA